MTSRTGLRAPCRTRRSPGSTTNSGTRPVDPAGWHTDSSCVSLPGVDTMTAFRLFVCALVVLIVASPSLPAAGPPVATYQYNRIHDPDGIGKFYMGREIAEVMGHEGAGWLDRPERIKEE